MIWVWKKWSLYKRLLQKEKNEQKEKLIDEWNVFEPFETNNVDVYVVIELVFYLGSANVARNCDQIQQWILVALSTWLLGAG